MTTNLELCNLALSSLGQREITDLADQDAVSKVCNINYQRSIDWVLREREWKCAVKRVALDTPEVTAPDYGWSASYQVPADHLRTIEVRTTSLKDYQENFTRWSQEGGLILCDVDSGIKVKYLAEIDIANIPGHVIDVIVFNLASRICIPITASKKLKEELIGEYKMALKDAASLDGMQGRNQTIKSSSLVRTRFR